MAVSLGCIESKKLPAYNETKNATSEPDIIDQSLYNETEIFTPTEIRPENETRKYVSTVWGKIKSSDEAKFVTSEKSYSAIMFVHPYTVGAFDPSTAEWVVVISSIPKMEKDVKTAIFRLDYQTFDLKKTYKFNYSVIKELALEEGIAIMEEEMRKESYGSKFVDREKVIVLDGNYIYTQPAVDFGGNIIINKYAGRAIFYATTVWEGRGMLIIPEKS